MSISKDDLGRMLNQCRNSLPGATDAAIKGQLFNTIDEFLKNSNSWSEWIPFTILASATNLVSGVTSGQDYLLTPAHHGMIVRLATIIDQNTVTYPATVSEIQPPGASIHLVWPQSQAINVQALVYKSILLPTTPDDIPIAPRWLLPMYERAIETGVIGYMQRQKAKPYADPELSAINIKSFLNQVGEARAAALRGNLYGGQAWRFPSTMRTCSQRGGVSTPFPIPTSWWI